MKPEERQYEGGAIVPIEPQEDPPIKPGQPSEPPQESPPGSPRPEVPPPMQEPGAPPRPEELPGNTPDELPVRGPGGPGSPSPAACAASDDLPDDDLPDEGPYLDPGAAYAAGDNVKLRFEIMA
jgi:hypothetical protein